MSSTALSAQGTKIEYNSGTVAVPVWTEVVNVTEISGFDGTATDIDTTDLSSTAKERLPGLQDWSKVTLAMNINLTEPSHSGLLAAKKTGKVFLWRYTLSDDSTITFQGYVTSFPIAAAVDSIYKGTVSVSISGDIEWTAAPSA